MATSCVMTVIQNWGPREGRLEDRAGHTRCSRANRLWPGEEVGRIFQAEAQDMRGLRGPRTMAIGEMGVRTLLKLGKQESMWDPLCCYLHSEGGGCVYLVCC